MLKRYRWCLHDWMNAFSIWFDHVFFYSTTASWFKCLCVLFSSNSIPLPVTQKNSLYFFLLWMGREQMSLLFFLLSTKTLNSCCCWSSVCAISDPIVKFLFFFCFVWRNINYFLLPFHSYIFKIFHTIYKCL